MNKELITQLPRVEQLFDQYAERFGKQQTAYRNHVYRLVNLVMAQRPVNDEELGKLQVAAFFHDAGIWLAGTFDYLHPGHESFLRQAGELGNELYVVVARDENVQRIKGCRPDHHECKRRDRVADLGIAKEVLLGYRGSDFLRIVGDLRPDVIALGYDQRMPAGLEEAFPQCDIRVLDALDPHRYKSSLYRQNAERAGN